MPGQEGLKAVRNSSSVGRVKGVNYSATQATIPSTSTDPSATKTYGTRRSSRPSCKPFLPLPRVSLSAGPMIPELKANLLLPQVFSGHWGAAPTSLASWPSSLSPSRPPRPGTHWVAVARFVASRCSCALPHSFWGT